MIGSALKNLFIEITDSDDFDDTSFYILANTAKMEIEMEREWEFLKDSDSSILTTGNYTNAYDNPTNFLMPLQMDTIYVNGSPYTVIRPEKWEPKKNIAGFVKFDINNSKFYLSGSPESGKTIVLNFIKESDDITADVEIDWPIAKFEPIIAYKMAELYYISDAVEASHNMAPAWSAKYNVLKSAMVRWDSRLKTAFQNNYNN